MYEISEELDQEPHSGRKEIDQGLHMTPTQSKGIQDKGHHMR